MISGEVDLLAHGTHSFVKLKMTVLLPAGTLLKNPDLLCFPNYQALCLIIFKSHLLFRLHPKICRSRVSSMPVFAVAAAPNHGSWKIASGIDWSSCLSYVSAFHLMFSSKLKLYCIVRCYIPRCYVPLPLLFISMVVLIVGFMLLWDSVLKWWGRGTILMKQELILFPWLAAEYGTKWLTKTVKLSKKCHMIIKLW